MSRPPSPYSRYATAPGSVSITKAAGQSPWFDWTWEVAESAAGGTFSLVPPEGPDGWFESQGLVVRSVAGGRRRADARGLGRSRSRGSEAYRRGELRGHPARIPQLLGRRTRARGRDPQVQCRHRRGQRRRHRRLRPAGVRLLHLERQFGCPGKPGRAPRDPRRHRRRGEEEELPTVIRIRRDVAAGDHPKET